MAKRKKSETAWKLLLAEEVDKVILRCPKGHRHSAPKPKSKEKILCYVCCKKMFRKLGVPYATPE